MATIARTTCPERAAGCRRHSVASRRVGVAHGEAAYNAAMAILAATDLNPRRLVIERLTHDRGTNPRRCPAGRLGLWVQLGTAPAVLLSAASPRRRFRSATASRGATIRARRGGRRLRARSDRSREIHGAVPVVAGQRIDVERFRQSELARIARLPAWRLVAAWLEAAAANPGDLGRRQPWRHGRGRVRARHPERCAKLVTISAAFAPTAGARQRGICSASWCATALRNGDVTTGMMRARQLGIWPTGVSGIRNWGSTDLRHERLQRQRQARRQDRCEWQPDAYHLRCLRSSQRDLLSVVTRPGSYNPSTLATALASAGAYNTADYESISYDNNGNILSCATARWQHRPEHLRRNKPPDTTGSSGHRHRCLHRVRSPRRYSVSSSLPRRADSAQLRL